MVTQSSIALIAYLSLFAPNQALDSGWRVSEDQTSATNGELFVHADQITKNGPQLMAQNAACIIRGYVVRAHTITVDIDRNSVTLTHVGRTRTE